MDIAQVLPSVLASLTGHSRYRPAIEWSSRSWVHNVFRAYELIFWRRVGIRPEVAAEAHREGGRLIVTYRFYSFEAVMAHVEGMIRGTLPRLVPKLVRVPQLQLSGPSGRLSSNYLFAIAFDATAGSTSSSGNDVTFVLTCSGSDRILFPGGKAYSSSTITAATYNSVSATLVDDQNSTGGLGGHAYLFYLLAPSTGSNNVVVTGNNDNHTGLAASYSGAKQSVPEASAKGVTDSSTSRTQAVTSISDNAWAVGVWANQTGAASAGTGATMRTDLGAFASSIADSGSATTPAGSISMQLTTAGSGNWASVAAAFAPKTTEIREMADSIMIGASRLATISRTVFLTRSLADSVMIGASRLATVAKAVIREMTDSVMIAAGRFATVSHIVGYVRSISDSIMNAAGRSAAVQRTVFLFRAMSDSIMIGASRVATLAYVRNVVRAMSDSIMRAKDRASGLIKAFVNGLGIGWSDKHESQGNSWSEKHTTQNSDWDDKHF